MPAQTLPFTVRTVMRFQKDTREQVHVFHTYSTDLPDATDLAAINTVFRDWWNDHYKGTASNQVALVEVTSTDIHTPNGLQVTLPVAPPIAGTLPSAPAPQNATQTISWRTAFSGRRNRGRSYTVGLIETDASDTDTVVPARVTSLAAAASALIADVLAIGRELVVASFTHNQTRAIISAVVENVVDSMRRRLPKRGR